MSSALRHLKHFITAKNNDDDRHEIRDYVLCDVDRLAHAFGVTPAAVRTTVARIRDDGELARKLLLEVKRVGARGREDREEERARSAQASADLLCTAVVWEEGRCHVDIASLLASTLTSRDGHLVFASPAWQVAISMGPLFALARLKRADLSAFVDDYGLHVRWTRGGLNLCAQARARSETIVVHLPAHDSAGRAA